MSFILDALKKSENERQRQSGPAFAEVPVAHPRAGQPWWVFAIGALLLVNLLVLLFVLFVRDKPPATRPTQNVASPAPTATATAPVPAPVAQTPAAAPVVTPAPSAAIAPAATRKDAGQPTAQSAPAPAAQARAIDGARTRSLAEAAGVEAYDTADPTLDYDDLDTVAAQVPDGPPMVQPLARRPVIEEAPAEALPTLNDIMLSGSTSLPEMHLDIHVYAPAAAERFVFINMRKYVEGQKLQEGPVVERITRDGVVLNQHGLRFLLPSQ